MADASQHLSELLAQQQRTPGDPALLRALGRAYVGQNDWASAAQWLAKALVAQPGDAGLRSALIRAAGLLQASSLYGTALAAFDALLSDDAGNREALQGRAATLQLLDRGEEARLAFERAIAIAPDDPAARIGYGVLLHGQRRFEEAVLAFRRALELDPGNAAATAHLVNAKRRLCDWRELDALTNQVIAATRAELASGDPVSAPMLGFLATGAPFALCMEVVRAVAAGVTRAASAQRTEPFRYARRGKRLRIGFLSPDFRGHSAGRMAATLVSALDRGRVELFGYSLVPDANRDDTTAWFAGVFDRFRDISHDAAATAAAHINADGINVLVDLAGYTRGARPEILALCPAPVQCHYLGLNLPLGGDWCPWLIADRTSYADSAVAGAVPARIAWLDGPWAATPRSADVPMTRTEAGLPPESLVFAAFAEPHKFDPESWRAWMGLLNAAPSARLWLLDGGDTVRRNLVRYAAVAGVSGDRLVWAPRIANAEHRRRLACADIALDTWVQKSGATVLEFLAAGVPVLTTRNPGPAFGAALVVAAGIPECVAENLAHAMGVGAELAHDPSRLARLRARLQEPAPLFDTRRWAAQVEAAFAAMWDAVHPTGS